MLSLHCAHLHACKQAMGASGWGCGHMMDARNANCISCSPQAIKLGSPRPLPRLGWLGAYMQTHASKSHASPPHASSPLG